MSKTSETAQSGIFEAIKADDLERVKAIISEDPSAVNAVASKRPSDTRGMSPLQVSLCTGRHRDIAWLLLKRRGCQLYPRPQNCRGGSPRPL